MPPISPDQHSTFRILSAVAFTFLFFVSNTV